MKSEPLTWYQELNTLSFRHHLSVMIRRLLGFKVEIREISEDEVPPDILREYYEKEGKLK